MKSIKDLLALRRQLKKRKPTFYREDNDKFENKRVGLKWRRPTGRHSKIKHQFKGSRKMPSCGYRSPVEVRGMNRKGFFPVVVFNVEDLAKIDTKTEIAVISSTVGIKKRMMILKTITDKKMDVDHIKDAAAELKKYEDYLKQNKESKKQRAVVKEKKVVKKAEQKTEAKTEQKAEQKEEKTESNTDVKTETAKAEHAKSESSSTEQHKKPIKKKKAEGEAQ